MIALPLKPEAYNFTDFTSKIRKENMVFYFIVITPQVPEYAV